MFETSLSLIIFTYLLMLLPFRRSLIPRTPGVQDVSDAHLTCKPASHFIPVLNGYSD